MAQIKFSAFICILWNLWNMVAWAESTGVERCGLGRVRYSEGGAVLEKKARFCFDSKNYILASENCRGSLQCEARKGTFLVRPYHYSQFGNPGFSACKAAGGLPQLFDIHFEGAWISLNRCFFKADQSFLNVSQFLHAPIMKLP